MPAKSLKVDSLELDLENPRITLASDQRDAMQKILNEQKVRLINLAESIAAKGVNPMDRFLVIRSARQGKFIVVEGNRRILAIKLLKNPSLIDDLEMAASFKRRLHQAASSFDTDKIEPLDCFEAEDRAQGREWINQRHIGADEGRGIVVWSARAGARFHGRYPAIQALDFVVEHGGLSDDQKELLEGKFPLTTLDRLLATPSVRATIGLDIVNDKLITDLPPEEVLKPLKRMVLDLAQKNINVTQLKSREQQDDYVAKFKSSDRPNLSSKTGTPLPIEGISERDFAASHQTVAKRSRVSRPSPRNAVIPKGCSLNVTTAKIAGIYDELKTLQLSKHKHAIAVLLRVFLELSVDEYLTKVAKIKLTYVNNSGRPGDKTLKMKVKETIADLVSKGAPARDFIGVTTAMTDQNHPFSIDTLHAYIHNRYFTPVDSHLVGAWDNAENFFDAIWP